MTRLPSSDAFFPSGNIENTTMPPPATHYANGNSPPILSPPASSSSKSTSGAPTATNYHFSLPPHVVPADSSPPDSHGSPPPSVPAPPAPASLPVSLPLTLSLSTLPYFPPPDARRVPRKFACSDFLGQGDVLAAGPDTVPTLSRSVSADGAAPQVPSSYLVQRLAQQNALIREAWASERTNLEADRRRVEEIYQQDRAIMEDVRDAWNNEKANMLREMQALKERIHRLEGENSAFKIITSQGIQMNGGVLSPLTSQQGDSVDGSADTPPYFTVASGTVANAPPQNKQSRNFSNMSSADAAASLPPGLDGASRRPHFAGPRSSHASPMRLPDASPCILDPRTQPETSTPRDFLAPSSDSVETPVPVIDIKEIHPKLEGISLKATAVQRSTFTETSKKQYPYPMPAKANGRQGKTHRSIFGKRPFSKDNAMQVLAAEESQRLTMHAGHTPNHSLSQFPTMTTVTEASTATGRSEGVTPTAIASAPPERHEEKEPGHNDVDLKYQMSGAILDDYPKAQYDDGAEEVEQLLMDPDDDVALKGPFMVKNIPAQDELFFSALNKKLEPISQGQGALPTVMQSPIAELHVSPLQAIAVGGDATHDTRATRAGHGDDDDDESDLGGKKTMEPDIPLKFKTTTNFGAPFGRM